jgi:predicted transport protein
MEETLLKNTGKTVDEWVEIVRATGIEKHSLIIKHLKEEHAFTHGFANMVAHAARQSAAASFEEDELITTQYSKGKEALKPIYDKLIKLIKKFGDDIEIAPKRANVSLRRARQFALIQPSTKTRIDLGLKYNESPGSERILGSGSFGTMCTNRVQITAIEDVDDELIGFLKEAYEQAGGGK